MPIDGPIPDGEAPGISRPWPRLPRFLSRPRPTIADLGLVIVYVALFCVEIRQITVRLDLANTQGGLYIQLFFGVIIFFGAAPK